MKWIKRWISLSLLTVLLAVGCNAETITEPEATATMNNPTTESNPPPLATAVSTPIPTETARTIRLTPAATPQVEIVPPLEESGIVGEVPEEMLTAVYADLIATQNVAQETITITRAESVIWNDGSLGCPQPGEVYTQATVQGYWIVLAANGQNYDYHAAENGTFILCENNLPVSPLAGTPTS